MLVVASVAFALPVLQAMIIVSLLWCSLLCAVVPAALVVVVAAADIVIVGRRRCRPPREGAYDQAVNAGRRCGRAARGGAERAFGDAPSLRWLVGAAGEKDVRDKEGEEGEEGQV